MSHQLTAQAVVFHGLSRQSLHGIHGTGKIPGCGGFGYFKKIILPDQPGRFADRFHGDIPGVRPAEIQKRKGVTHSAIGDAGDEGGGLLGEGHVLLPGDVQKPVPDDLRGDALKIEALAAGLDGGRDLVNLGGGQNEDDVLRRLLHDFQQGIDRPARKHMGLIDDIDPVFCDIGQENGFLPQVTDVIDTVIAGGIDLHNIHQTAVIHSAAAVTFPAGAAAYRSLAVYGLGDELGAGGFAGAPAAHQQIGVGGLSLYHLVFQRGGDVLLPHDFLEGAGAPLAV